MRGFAIAWVAHICNGKRFWVNGKQVHFGRCIWLVHLAGAFWQVHLAGAFWQVHLASAFWQVHFGRCILAGAFGRCILAGAFQPFGKRFWENGNQVH